MGAFGIPHSAFGIDATRRSFRRTVPGVVAVLVLPLTFDSQTGALSSRTPDCPAGDQPGLVALQDVGMFERRLSRPDEHRYQVPLKPGERARVIVEQKGVDLLVRTRDPRGRLIAEFDDEIRNFGDENVALVADEPGTYSIDVIPSPRSLASGEYAIRVASRGAATGAERRMQESRSIRTKAIRLERAARLADARALFEHAFRLGEAGSAPAGYLAALTLELAGNALARRDDLAAQTLYQRAIDMFERVLGSGHPYPAMARSRLALLYQNAGDGPRAEALLRQSIDNIEKVLGKEHLWYAQCLITLGNLRMDAGDLETAEALDRRAMGILERLGDVDSSRYSGLLNNLGEIYRRRSDLSRADELYHRAMAVAQKLEGPQSYNVSIYLQNLGSTARQRKDYARALEYDERALAIREHLLGSNHADIAPLLNNLAIVYRLTGRTDRALSTHFRSLEIWESTVGPYHPGTLNAVGNIARTYAALGDTAKAIAFQRRADAILEKQLELNLSVGSEREKLAFARSVSERTDRTISLHLDQAPRSDAAASLAAEVVLQRKGRVQDSMANVFAAVRRRVSDAGDRALLRRLNETTSELARVALKPPGQMTRVERQRSLAALELRKERLEAKLSEHSAELRADMGPVTLDAVQAAIDEDAALLEFATFRPFDPKAERNAEAYGPTHYGVYVVRRHGTPRGFDLGPATAIEYMAGALRDALRDPQSTDLYSRARAVDERLLEPVRASLDAVKRLVISPDGDLNLVPFEALIGKDGRYLVERYEASYVTSGRDLLRLQVPRRTPTRPILFADPLFGEPARSDGTRRARPQQALLAARSAAAPGQDLSSMYFAPLPATATEARAIRSLFPEAALLTGSRATKDVLRTLRAPRILHIASHGFFLDDGARGDPLLRSGLAFAGANLDRPGNDRGILTALEASGLDLWGTKLVTLSACDTGVGDIRNGEGVYGLRRAFVLAGAETLVMSLWPVSDFVAGNLMVAYYTGLRAGLGRGEALRQAKLAMLRRGRRHPYYWAGFIQSGQWADLDGRR